jgi:hypothetical protein
MIRERKHRIPEVLVGTVCIVSIYSIIFSNSEPREYNTTADLLIVLLLGSIVIFSISIKTVFYDNHIYHRRLWICKYRIVILKGTCRWEDVTEVYTDNVFEMLFIRASHWETNHPCRMVAVSGAVWGSLNRRAVLRFVASKLPEMGKVKLTPEAAAILEEACRPSWHERMISRWRSRDRTA